MATLKHRIGKVILPILPLNRRAIDLLRFELNAQLTKVSQYFSPIYQQKLARVRKQKGISLNVGSGGRGLSNWINTDITYHKDTYFRMDLRRKLPFKDGSVKRIFAEHVIEHIEFRQNLPKALSEFHRILEDGGTLRIIVPNAKRFIEAYIENSAQKWAALGFDLSNFPKDMPTPMCMINHVFHQNGEHYFGYDFETMAWILKQAGFSQVIEQEFKQSIDSDLAIDREEHRSYSLYVDAIK